MTKWLGAAALALLVGLFLLWRMLDEPAAAPISKGKPAAIEPTKTVATGPSEAAIKAAATAGSNEEAAPAKEVMDPGSELFDKHFIDVIPKRLWKHAAVCYEGKLGSRHRNSNIRYSFKVVVKKGKVTINDLKVATDEENGNKPVNTINDPALESCFFQKLSGYAWDGDDDMPEGYTIPDYEYPDELTISPERSKKYYKDNIDYVGGEAPSRGGRAPNAGVRK
jgi:hypothetical protein